jgi:flavin-dependent dehydrogenase
VPQQNFETIYQEELARCPAVRERVTIGKQVKRFRAAKEYSYRSSRVAGDGWVLVGDAFGFLDPLYSSGVLLALKSGSLAADAVVEGLNKGDTSAVQLGKWGPGFIQGMERMRRLVCEYYDGFSFGQFVRRHPHFKGHLTDLLIGDLFKNSVDEVFGPMDAMRAQMNGAE